MAGGNLEQTLAKCTYTQRLSVRGYSKGPRKIEGSVQNGVVAARNCSDELEIRISELIGFAIFSYICEQTSYAVVGLNISYNKPYALMVSTSANSLGSLSRFSPACLSTGALNSGGSDLSYSAKLPLILELKSLHASYLMQLRDSNSPLADFPLLDTQP